MQPTSAESGRVSDEELLRRCQGGDEAALGELIARYQERLFRIAYRVLRDGGRAEDAVADALAAVWFRCGSWRGDATAGTWIHQVGYRVVIDHARSRGRWWRIWTRAKPSESSDPSAVAAASDHRAEVSRKLDQALATLSAEDRALVHLHYFEEQSLAEIATIVNTTRDALKMRLSRARARLRQVLGDGDEFFGSE
jgi:RNA polymerase sigma-70 factor (ECF subfamily)